MPANQHSLQLTTAYRQRLDATRHRVQSFAARHWPTIETLDGTEWSERVATVVNQAQVEAVRATAGYLTAFLSLELGKPVQGPTIVSRSYAGFGADGGSLAGSLQSPLIGVYARLKDGSAPAEALQYGLDRAKRQVGMDFDAAHRKALLEAIDKDSRFAGWQRATSGTCGACLGVASHVHSGIHFPVHPGCHCVSEPVVEGVPNVFPRAIGAQLFAEKSEAEQDEAVGPRTAALLRTGMVEIDDLAKEEEFDGDTPGIITQRPLNELVSEDMISAPAPL